MSTGKIVMRVSFIADTATFDKIEDALVAGLLASNESGKHLVFQRNAPDDPEDWGVYLEYSDQGYSGYNAITGCRISRERVEVDLSKPLGNLTNVTGIDVDLQVDALSYEQFLYGLKQIFGGKAKDRLVSV